MAKIQALDPITIGSDKIYDAVAYRSDLPGERITLYTDAATFEASLYKGDDQASVLTPTCAWTDSANGAFEVAFAAAQTADLDEGVYRLDVFVTEDSIRSHAIRASIEVVATAGSGTAPKTYCSYEDMLQWASFIRDLVDTQEDQSGFAEQRALARKWVDNLAQKHYRYGARGSNRQTSLDHLLGFGYSRGEMDLTLKGWLDADGLILDDDVTACAAHYAISLVLRKQLTPGRMDKMADYSRMAGVYSAEAKARAASLVLRIDTTDPLDGNADIFINLGITDTLYA